MATPEELKQWKANAEAAVEARKEEEEEEHKRLELQLHLRGEQKAAEDKAKAQREARGVWLAEGGSVADFEKQWEALYKDLVYQRTLKRMTSGDPFGIKSSLNIRL